MRLLNAMLIAFSTYSRIPVPPADWSEENRRYSLCFFPAVGLAAAAAQAAWILLARGRSGPLLFGAGCALIPLAVTGGIHMDGLMDTADALASHASRERRLEILKDSRAGAFAVMACCAYLLLSAALWAELRRGRAFACVGFVASRALSAAAAVRFRQARGDGMLAGAAGCAGKEAVTLASCGWTALCLLLWGLLGGLSGAAAMAAVCLLCLLLYRRGAYRDFGGVTGDLAGAFLQMTELCLLAAAVLLEGIG